VPEINAKYGLHIPDSLLEIVRNDIREMPFAGVEPIPLREVEPRLPYSRPPKIWCIGLNYLSHAEDIQAVQPEEPASFMKPASCMFQPGGEIVLPPPEVSNDVDAEGELGVILGRNCRFVAREKALDAVYGFTTTLDLTALDVLRRNPRYLARAKSIDTFFSFGPVIVTSDEIADIGGLEVVTEHNGAVCSRDFVRNMKMGPLDLIAFHSDYFTWEAGDVLSTGCPKGARIQAGDHVRARIDGVGVLDARVR
jgi:2-keto-4-pentenoate hydratase/2-oxohepta-3-ene-1,7-dioic acid hydratase in catechol pathway